MINHMRTLILNRGPDFMGGLAYVPPGYSPAVLDGETAKFRDAIVPRSLDAVSLLLKTHTILKLADVPELNAITDFDGRLTYSLSDRNTVEASGLIADILAVSGRGGVENELFNGYGAADDLYYIYSHTPETVLRTGACIHAYASKLDSIRETGDG